MISKLCWLTESCQQKKKPSKQYIQCTIEKLMMNSLGWKWVLLNQCIDHLQFWFYLFVKHETREKNAHFVQYVHRWSQNLKYTCTCTWLCKCNVRRHGDLSLLSCINRNRLTWSWPICCLLWGSLRLCTCFWSTDVLVWFPDPPMLVICTPRVCAVRFSLASSHLCLYSAYSDIQ
jgi:hypothetical protein